MEAELSLPAPLTSENDPAQNNAVVNLGVLLSAKSRLQLIRLFVPDGLGSGPNFGHIKWYIAVLAGTIPLLLFCLNRSKLLIKRENQKNESLRNINRVCYITFFHKIVVMSITDGPTICRLIERDVCNISCTSGGTASLWVGVCSDFWR